MPLMFAISAQSALRPFVVGITGAALDSKGTKSRALIRSSGEVRNKQRVDNIKLYAFMTGIYEVKNEYQCDIG